MTSRRSFLIRLGIDGGLPMSPKIFKTLYTQIQVEDGYVWIRHEFASCSRSNNIPVFIKLSGLDPDEIIPLELFHPPTMMSTLTGVNLRSGLDPANVTLPSNFTLHAVSKQDVWRPPEVPAGEMYDTPAIYVQYGPIHKFKSARVSICDMVGKKQFDQAGMIFLVNSPGLKEEKYDSWIKTGIEIVDTNSTSKVMAVATPGGGYSDWNLVDMPTTKCVTIQAERQQGGPWMYIYVLEGEKKSLMRLVTWPFQKHFDKMLGVGAIVSRHEWSPGKEPFTGEPNSARFEGLRIDWGDWNGTTSQYNV